MEFKWLQKDDPFCEPHEQMIGKGDRQEKVKMFICDHKVAVDTLGQITAQYCTHIFSVFIVRDKAQILCWEQSGAIVSEAF